ncbi:sugar transporter SWEET1-like isoform X2 [Oncorhynchus tshawytscha]|uniref:sugar transporter SWEET1-like isoform X2 n=1 Tax=Oncorhynchus tshawytscha TaxID=74940 RepID=UPI001C3D5535|nr:sugar transporter SWEET1-like isoform X2 [Oncorhynchus tshawytscha]
MEFLQFLSWACIVFTVGMFSTGLTDLKKMRASKSADNVQFLPFLTTCLNNLGWLYYGILKTDGTLVLVNTIGACLQSLYIFSYCHYTNDKMEMVRTGSVERLSYSLTVATFLTSTSWTLYGLQLQDYYIMVPNTPGIVTSLIRFFLFWRFASVNQGVPSYKLIEI